MPPKKGAPIQAEIEAESVSEYKDDSSTLSEPNDLEESFHLDEGLENSKVEPEPAERGRKAIAKPKAEGAPVKIGVDDDEPRTKGSRLKQAERAVCHR